MVVSSPNAASSVLEYSLEKKPSDEYLTFFAFKKFIIAGDAVGLVEKNLVCKAEFNLILPDEIKKYNLKE